MSKLVDMPMNEWSRAALADRSKVATSRTKKVGEPGDYFEVDGTFYVITHVIKLPLHVIATQFYEEEGAESPGEFKQVWKNIHYRKGFVEDQEVYLHLFRPLNFTGMAEELESLTEWLTNPETLASVLSPGYQASLRRDE